VSQESVEILIAGHAAEVRKPRSFLGVVTANCDHPHTAYLESSAQVRLTYVAPSKNPDI
jgi:hypothetical protein